MNRHTLKHTAITAEGITLTWTGELEQVNLTLPKEPQGDGMYHIVIKTNSFEDIPI